MQIDFDKDGEINDLFIIPDPKGEYNVNVIPEIGAESTDNYTLVIRDENTSIVIADEQLIGNIPDRSYCIIKNDEGILVTPVVYTHDQYERYEGTEITLNASDSYDPDGNITFYEWDTNEDGEYDINTTSPTVNYTWGDDFYGKITLRVTDDDGLNSTATVEALIHNVPPIVEGGPNQTVYSGETVFFNASFTDPGWLDTHNATWNFSENSLSEGELTEENDPPDSTGNVTGNYTYYRAGNYTVTLDVTDDDGDMGSDSLTVTVKRIPIPMDVKPRSDPNSINPNSKGVIPVALMNQTGWKPIYIDPSLVNISTIKFGPEAAEPIKFAYEDVDKDGDNDLVLHFKTQETGIMEDDTDCTLFADLIDGRQVIGNDKIRTVPPSITRKTRAVSNIFRNLQLLIHPWY